MANIKYKNGDCSVMVARSAVAREDWVRFPTFALEKIEKR